MTRRAVFVLRGGQLGVKPERTPTCDDVQIKILRDKSVEVTRPNIAKDQLITLMATAFMGEHPAEQRKLEAVLQESPAVSITFTSRRCLT